MLELWDEEGRKIRQDRMSWRQLEVIGAVMQFRSLKVGDLFEFYHASQAFHRDLVHGPWRKISPRKYETAYHPGAGTVHVGTVRAWVVKAAENGQRYVPCGGA